MACQSEELFELVYDSLYDLLLSRVARTSFKPLLKRSGLPDICFHDLRHTCATLLLARGHHPKLVQELLGHASVTLTLDRYSHALPSMGD